MWWEDLLTPENLKQFFRVRDEDGNLDWEQVRASAVQVGFMIITALIIIIALQILGIL